MNKLTVMMNCMNGERYLPEALQAIIDQTFKDWDLYFFDNQSTDNSIKIFNNFKDSRFKYFYFDKFYNLGQARKKAWKEINSEYVAICDVDDISLNQRFEFQTKFLDLNSDYGVVGSNVFLIDSNSNKLNEIKYEINSINLKSTIEYKHVFNSATLMFRKSAVDKVGGYDSKYEMVNDYDLLFRLSREFNISNLPETLVCNRQHQNNLSFLKIVRGQIELLKLQYFILGKVKNFIIKNKLIYNMFSTLLRIIYHSIKNQFK